MEQRIARSVPSARGEVRGLLLQLRSGDARAFSAATARCEKRLEAVARRMLHDAEDAREAVQEGLLSAWAGIDRFEGNALLSTWLHRIVVNACLMTLRAERRSPLDRSAPDAFDEHHPPAGLRGSIETPEEEVQRLETRALVRRCVEELPHGYRAVIVMRDLEELDTAAAAERLGITTNALKIRLYRARKALRSALAPKIEANACCG